MEPLSFGEDVRKTALHSRHQALGAKMVEFAGWEMPLQYKGIIPEHHAVRERVGLFDVSHMGRVKVSGPDAETLLDYLSTNLITGKKIGSATYTVWCHSEGGSVDDLIVYREGEDRFFVVVNASNREKDLAHLIRESSGYRVSIEACKEEGILALQGPLAQNAMRTLFPDVEEVKPMTFLPLLYQGKELILSGTGYTGAGGYELYGAISSLIQIWDRFMAQGVEPVGLGARDTLRLEMGFALYGHELSDTISPNESVSAWTVKWSKPDFLGKKRLAVLEQSSHKRQQLGIVLQEGGIGREGYPVLKQGEIIGRVTSGTFSPSLRKAIAIILVEGNFKEGDNLEVDIRGKRVAAEVASLPFWRQKK